MHAGSCGGGRSTADPLELQGVVSPLMWVLEPKPSTLKSSEHSSLWSDFVLNFVPHSFFQNSLFVSFSVHSVGGVGYIRAKRGNTEEQEVKREEHLKIY